MSFEQKEPNFSTFFRHEWFRSHLESTFLFLLRKSGTAIINSTTQAHTVLRNRPWSRQPSKEKEGSAAQFGKFSSLRPPAHNVKRAPCVTMFRSRPAIVFALGELASQHCSAGTSKEVKPTLRSPLHNAATE